MKRLLNKVLTVMLIFTVCTVLADSKTEEAHEKLKKAGSYEEQEPHHHHYHECKDDDESDFWFDFYNFLFCMTFNVKTDRDELGYELQRVRYNPKPYHRFRCPGHRNEVSSHSVLIHLDNAVGTGLSEDTKSVLSQTKLNFSGFALNFKYKYINEKNAPYDINYYSLMLERKSFVFPRFDSGISCGYDKIGFGKSYYDGFSIGYNLEFYPFSPLSVKFQPGIMFHKDLTIIDINSELRFHWSNLYLGIGHNYFDIDNVIFRSLLLHTGFFF